MIRARIIAARERQARLAERAQSEREQVDRYLARADAALSWVDQVRGAIAELRRRPLLIAGVALGVFALRPRRVLKLLASSLWLWRLSRELRPVIAGFIAGAKHARRTSA